MTTNQVIGWIVFVIVIIAIIAGLQENGWLRKLIASTPSLDTNNTNASAGRYGNDSNELTCEYIDSNGRTVKITGSGTEFENLCRNRRQTDRLYYNNVYYTPYRYYYYPTQYSYYPWSSSFVTI